MEVFDNASDIVFYDIEKHQIFTDSRFRSKDNLETFPTFSPDGKRLYFCSASMKQMPEGFKDIRYNLLSVSFDENTGRFGAKIDTLFSAEKEGRSAKFPRISPDGKFLVACDSNRKVILYAVGEYKVSGGWVVVMMFIVINWDFLLLCLRFILDMDRW